MLLCFASILALQYSPSSEPIEATRGKVEAFSNMLASKPEGVLKGGSLTFIAGFSKPDGTILCPNITTDETATPFAEGSGVVPLVKCGQYTLRLWPAPRDGPYYGAKGRERVICRPYKQVITSPAF